MSTSAFSSSDDVIVRKVDCESHLTRQEDLEEVYEIKQCTEWLTKNCFTNIALQFPDNILVDAPKVASIIQDSLPNAHVFILGDTSYGSCCVDEVGAQHYKADCVIHFGHACLSPTTRLPVLYVFAKFPIDVAVCVANIQQDYSDRSTNTVLVYEPSYAHIIEKLYKELLIFLPQLVLSRLHIGGNASVNDFLVQNLNSVICTESTLDHHLPEVDENVQQFLIQKCERSIHFPARTDVSGCNFLFLGASESPTLINMMMTFNKSSFFNYDPQSQVFEPVHININKTLMKRYYLVERAKDAKIVGIVVGTLGVGRFREIIDHLKVLLKKAGKKTYTFVVGKLNPAKLANFAEVDIYVMVSCPESSLLEQKDFYRPVVTPFEMEIACNKAREWTGEYTADFAELLPGSAMHIQAPEDSEYTGEGDVSLISNRIRTIGPVKTPETHVNEDKGLILRSEAMAVVGMAENAGQFFSMRSWKGLEKQLGETPVVEATEGQKGIAMSYENEHS